MILFILIFGFAATIFWPDLWGGEVSDQKKLWDAILYVLQKGTFQQPDFFKPANDVGRLLDSIIPLIIPGQAALFMLALRNRLGRR